MIIIKQYKNKLTVIIRQTEKLYYCNLLLHTKHSTRELWKIYTELVNKGKRNITNVKKLVVNDVDLNDNESIAKAMNQYFVTVGKEMSKSHNQGNEYRQFLSDPINNTMFLSQVCQQEVINEINELANSDISGIDNCCSLRLLYHKN